MRKLISTAAFVFLAVLAVSSTAFADYIPIGSVAFDVDGVEQPGRLILTNQTGDNVQDPDFPVQDFVSFLNIFLTTVPYGDLHPNAELIDTNLGDPGYDFNSADFAFGTFPRSVLIGGSVANQQVGLSTGGQWLIGGNVFMCVVNVPPCLDNGGVGDDLVQPFGTVLQGGELGIIYVEGRRIPEPVTLSLLGLGVAGAFVRRRFTARG